MFSVNTPRRFKAIERVVTRKQQMLHVAVKLADLRAPPGNRLETLRGDRRGQHSIRINNQWRVCSRCRSGWRSHQEPGQSSWFQVYGGWSFGWKCYPNGMVVMGGLEPPTCAL